MASKATKATVGGAHTAGIFADMTVDGPEIGTLVVIVDKARNLPNRKAMGKQDPYCAARLGKEAKKTETDKRGGQTPKWDQELRFTVHDSPDYYQLKVSVFNDDRKTELIGETWVSLEQTIVPGGGKQDKWHQLNCKGRFAGEIRIELTYYDTRPKEPKAEEHRQTSATNGYGDTRRESNSGVGGPRQPKPIKRRPLPSDPTMIDESRSSPQTFTPPPANPQFDTPQLDSPAPSSSSRAENVPINDMRYYPSEQDQYRSSPPAANGYSTSNNVPQGQEWHMEAFDDDRYRRTGQQHEPGTYVQEELGVQQHASLGNAPSYSIHGSPALGHQAHSYQSNDSSNAPSFESRYDSSSAQITPNAYIMPEASSFPSLPQHSSMPEFGMRHEQLGYAQPHHRSSLPRSEDYEQNHLRHVSHDEDNASYLPTGESVEDEAPPPPPVHRSSGLQSPAVSGRKSHADSYPPISGPAPLNVRHARTSISASPLSQVQTNSHHSNSNPSTSPTAMRKQPQSYSSRSSHQSYNSPERRMSPEHPPISPSRDYSQPTPPSLIPGYDPRIADDESERLMRENHSIIRQNSEPTPQFQAYARQRTPNEAQPLPRTDVPPQLLMLGNGQSNRPHQSSAPVIPRRRVSPELRTPVRKSVSPQPAQASGERRQSAVPFGPDSYDAFNPALSDAASINSPGPKYNTPEQAKEAQYEREREAKLAEGPIIGSDGREIDPSDHLPAETWAPEPESKAAKKKPEVTVRFKRSPAGAQPMPVAARRPTEPGGRPGPMVTPAYAHSSDAISPTSAARSRLQKKSRVAIAQPVSSPVVPTLNTNIRAGMPRAASEHPLREHENYSYGSSPTYTRVSPGNVPPPIPGKVPLSAGAGQEDWGMSALSEEMRRIDIGVSASQGRARRNRYGVSEGGRY